MVSTELEGAIVRMRTKDEYNGMLGKVCGIEEEDKMVVVKHRPIAFPYKRNTTMHCFRMNEIEIIRS